MVGLTEALSSLKKHDETLAIPQMAIMGRSNQFLILSCPIILQYLVLYDVFL